MCIIGKEILRRRAEERHVKSNVHYYNFTLEAGIQQLNAGPYPFQLKRYSRMPFRTLVSNIDVIGGATRYTDGS